MFSLREQCCDIRFALRSSATGHKRHDCDYADQSFIPMLVLSRLIHAFANDYTKRNADGPSTL
jgi:hypothetical protein